MSTCIAQPAQGHGLLLSVGEEYKQEQRIVQRPKTKSNFNSVEFDSSEAISSSHKITKAKTTTTIINNYLQNNNKL